MKRAALIFGVCSIAKSALVEIHETSFNEIKRLTSLDSPSQIWLLKQADQALLAIRSQFPGDTHDSRMHSMMALTRVVEHVLTRDPPFSDIQIHHIGSIIESRLKNFQVSLNQGIGMLASDLLSETGLDILSFEGMISPPALQASMARVLRSLVVHMGRGATEHVKHLYKAYQVQLEEYAQASDTVIGRYEAAITRLGFDVQASMPSWSTFIKIFERNPPPIAAVFQDLKASVLRELEEFESEIVSWAVLLNHPRFIAQAVAMEVHSFRYARRSILVKKIGECLHGRGPRAERICANLELLKVFFRHTIERDLSKASESDQNSWNTFGSPMLIGMWDSESIKSYIKSLEQLPLKYSLTLEDGPLTDFPVDSPVLIRLKTSLKILVHYEDNLEGLASLRMSFVDAVRSSVHRLSPYQLTWLDNFVREGLFGSTGTSARFLQGTFEESAALIAYELARVCQIKLFDFIPANSMPVAEHIRSIVSNLIVTEGGVIDKSVFSVLKVAADSTFTPEQRALYADAWRTYTVAHKSFELRPVDGMQGMNSLGRETAVAGFLLNSFREHPQEFMKVLSEYKTALYAPRRLQLSRLPPFVDDYVGLLASPMERLTPLVIRIDSVYRQHAQRIAELTFSAVGSYTSEYIRAIKLFPAAIFRQLILRGEDMYKPVPEEYLAPALKFAMLFERFPDNFSESPLRGALIKALRSGLPIVWDIQKRPLEINRNTDDLDTVLAALA